MKREPRLQFSDADLAEPKLEKPIKRVKKAEAKADKAQAKIPKKTVAKKEHGFDPATGKVKTQLRFEEVDKKKPPSKLTHAVQDAPANFVLSQVHREVRQSEDDNVGVEAAHKVEQAVESGGRLVQSVHRAHQLKPYRAAIRAEKKLERANLDALQKKAEIDSPTSNPVSKWQQKQAIKKQYAAAKHNQAAQTISRCHGIWSTSTILRILADERYTGVYVIGKRAVLEVGGTRSRLKDRESWYIIPDHHPAIIEKVVFDTVQASQLRFSQPNKKKRDYPLKGKAFCGCCGHALSRTMQKTSYYYCRHSEADVESRCHKMRLNAAELEQTVFLTLKKQMEAAAPLAPDGTLRVDASVPERAEYEQQIEALQDGKRALV
ncbi:MAG: recombinase family protein [Oscillospiraceae bacterium]